MPGISLPAFPENFETHPLLVVDYELLRIRDVDEIERLWDAATTIGFWYLKNHGADADVAGMFKMGEATLDLPMEEKLKYERGEGGRCVSAGYKHAGASATDETGTLDSVEYLNIAKDDVMAYPDVAIRRYPPEVNDCMESVLKPFVQKSMEINNTILAIFENKLGMNLKTLLDRHSLHEPSGSEARLIKKSGSTVAANSEQHKVALGAHTDFGSLSFLHNRLGGLQVLPPGSSRWQYVGPLPNHAVCNVGDALTLFSGGILHSCMHRVVAPPDLQAAFDRWSLVFFTRPGDDISLRALVDDSEMVKKAIDGMDASLAEKYFPGVNANEWFVRRSTGRRVKNRKASKRLSIADRLPLT